MLYLPTPDSVEGGSRGGSQHPDKRALSNRTINLADVVEHTLPTPKIKDRAKRGPAATGGPDLGEVVQLFNSPTSSDGTGVGVGRRKESTLRGQVDDLLPTPTAQHAARSRTVERGKNGGTSDPHIGTTLQDWADGLLPTPSTAGGGERTRGGERSDELLLAGVAEDLFPTPTPTDMGERKSIEEFDDWQARMADRHGTGGHGRSLDVEARRLMPTPRATDGTNGGPAQRGSAGDLALPSAALELMPTPDAQMGGAGGRSGHPDEARDRGHHVTINEVAQNLLSWGPYEPAIRRWESMLGRVAPWATEPSPRSKKGRLAPRFVEWMMGWPEGWVTALKKLSRNAQLRILGNGVVPQQASEAVRFLLAPPPRRDLKLPRRAVKRASPRGMMVAARKAGWSARGARSRRAARRVEEPPWSGHPPS